MIDTEWLRRLPKVELHIHLEGAIPYSAFFELIRKYKKESEIPNIKALEQKFSYNDFPHFLSLWGWKNEFIREYEDFTFISSEFARQLASQNIIYAEVFFSPSDFWHHDLQTQEIAQAIRLGLSKVHEVEVSLIADLVRNNGAETAMVILNEVNEVKPLGIVGIGIGGAEHLYPPELFAKVFEKAKKLGFFTSAHAGEGDGPESVWGAIKHLRVDRIGHGVRAIEDNALVDYISEHQIPLEMCPISNLKTGIVESIAKHPIRTFFERAIPVTVNTDDPMMFGNSLVDEFAALVGELGFSKKDIMRLLLNAIDVAWLPQEKKLELSDHLSQNAPE